MQFPVLPRLLLPNVPVQGINPEDGKSCWVLAALQLIIRNEWVVHIAGKLDRKKLKSQKTLVYALEAVRLLATTDLNKGNNRPEFAAVVKALNGFISGKKDGDLEGPMVFISKFVFFLIQQFTQQSYDVGMNQTVTHTQQFMMYDQVAQLAPKTIPTITMSLVLHPSENLQLSINKQYANPMPEILEDGRTKISRMMELPDVIYVESTNGESGLFNPESVIIGPVKNGCSGQYRVEAFCVHPIGHWTCVIRNGGDGRWAEIDNDKRTQDWDWGGNKPSAAGIRYHPNILVWMLRRLQ